jgi:hypothetical protein
MKTLEEVIADCEIIARDKKAAAEYYGHKYGKNSDYQELREAAEEHEQLTKWLMELKGWKKEEERKRVRVE